MTSPLKIPRPKRESRWLPPVVLISLVGWLVLRESGALDVGDVFWHLRTGDLILDAGLPRRDPFSWTAAGEPWQPNAWLGDVLWASIRSLFGSAGVSLIGGATVLTLALLLFRGCRRAGSGPWASVAAVSITVVVLSPFIVPRPLLIGLLLLPVALEASARFRGGSARSLLAVAALMAIWSNLHGSFVTGVGIIGLASLGWAIDKRQWLRPAVLSATAAVAGLLNPFGVSAYLHTLDIRDESVNIDEWQPLALDDARGMLLVATMVATAWALQQAWRTDNRNRVVYGGNRRWESIIPVLALAITTFAVIRTGAFFLIVAAPVVAARLSRVRIPRVRTWAGQRVGPLAIGLVVAGIVLAAQQIPTLSKAGEPGNRFSDDLVAAIPVDCLLLNEYDVGGFVIDRRWPGVLVSQDGRNDLYGADELRRQEELFRSVDVAAFDDTGVQCVLADRDRPLAAALAASDSWELRAESSELVLLVKQ